MPAPEIAEQRIIEIGDVGVIGIGGTHARFAINYANGQLGSFEDEPTPSDKAGFVDWMADKALTMFVDEGVSDMFVGFPGPTQERGAVTEVGPLVNVPFLKNSTMQLERELAGHDPLLRRLIDNGDLAVAVGNDGHLHAAAAAHFHGLIGVVELSKGEQVVAEEPQYVESVGGLIVGTGIGGDVVDLMDGVLYHRKGEELLRPVYGHRLGLREWGHWLAGEKGDFEDDYESRYAGPALNGNHDFGKSALEAGDDPDAEIWKYAGTGYADLIGEIALSDNPKLIVISGGFGSREHGNYGSAMRRRMTGMLSSGNVNLRLAIEATTVVSSDPEIADSYELYGPPTLLAARRAAA